MRAAKFGSIGHIGAFSFNYYKNMTSGEGGGVAVNDDAIAERARCAIDPCHFYWNGRDDERSPSPATARAPPSSWARCSTSSSTASTA